MFDLFDYHFHKTQSRLKTDKELPVIGWVERVLLGLKETDSGSSPLVLKAKIDTGAQTSCLHALHVRQVYRDSKPYVRFIVPVGVASIEVEAPLVRRGVVKTSEGIGLERFFISADIAMGSQEFSIVLSLNDRSSMVYPVLLGREFLKDRFVIDVSRKFVLPKPALW